MIDQYHKKMKIGEKENFSEKDILDGEFEEEEEVN